MNSYYVIAIHYVLFLFLKYFDVNIVLLWIINNRAFFVKLIFVCIIQVDYVG